MSIVDSNEVEILEAIAKGGKVALDLYLENCPNCDKFAPIFEKVSKENPDITFLKMKMPRGAGATELKKKFLNAGGSIDAPFLIVCDKGEMLYRHFGLVDEQTYKAFVLNGVAPPDKKQLAAEESYRLLARYGEINLLMKELPIIEQKIYEINKFLGK